MRFRAKPRTTHGRAFTLIELLVVVAIISMLMAILLPSLSKARAQARAVLCASRISQLGKAMLIYADDFEETPPFVGVGFEDLGDNSEWHGQPLMDYWAENENWLIPHIPTIWNLPEEDWPDDSTVRNGKLFSYTRFEQLYRCPDFERVAGKEQNQFNYTRTVMGRKVLSALVGDAEAGGDDLAPGPILRISAIHAPGSMYMLLDEQWDFHVAGNYDGQPEEGIIDLGSFWMGADSIHGILGDCIGDYHGARGKSAQVEGIRASGKGNIAYYDGHVEAVPDPLPGRVITIDLDSIGTLVEEAGRVLGPIIQQVYAQRGVEFQLEDALGLIR